MLRSSWEIGTIGININQHGQHTKNIQKKNYWTSPSWMVVNPCQSTISMVIFNRFLYVYHVELTNVPTLDDRQRGQAPDVLRRMDRAGSSNMLTAARCVRCLFHVPTKKCNGVQWVYTNILYSNIMSNMMKIMKNMKRIWNMKIQKNILPES